MRLVKYVVSEPVNAIRDVRILTAEMRSVISILHKLFNERFSVHVDEAIRYRGRLMVSAADNK